MTAQQEILAHADAHRQRCQSAFDEFQAILAATQPTQYLWPRSIQRLYDTLARRNAQARRDYYRALKHQPITTQPITTASRKAPPEPPPAPKPEPDFRDNLYRQSAEIRVIDGKAVTVHVDYPAAFFLSRTDWNATAFCRTLCFEDGVVPPEYAYANMHDGETFPFAPAVFLYYAPEEFMRLCQLEIDTNSPHLLDGKRLHMWRYTGQS